MQNIRDFDALEIALSFCIFPSAPDQRGEGTLCSGLRQAQGDRLSTAMGIGPRRQTGQGEEGQQNQIHLPGLRPEWAKSDALLICGGCYEDGEGNICLMLAEPGEEAEAA